MQGEQNNQNVLEMKQNSAANLQGHVSIYGPVPINDMQTLSPLPLLCRQIGILVKNVEQ